jgi:hypothetical protein
MPDEHGTALLPLGRRTFLSDVLGRGRRRGASRVTAPERAIWRVKPAPRDAASETADVPLCATPCGGPVNARWVVLCAARARESAVRHVRESGVLIAYVERGGY